MRGREERIQDVKLSSAFQMVNNFLFRVERKWPHRCALKNLIRFQTLDPRFSMGG